MEPPPETEPYTDEETRLILAEQWPIISAWKRRLGGIEPPPGTGSSLELDDLEDPSPRIRDLAHTSLAIGTDCQGVADSFLWENGPPTWALDVLYRTAMLCGAQAIWLLSPHPRPERVARARKLLHDTRNNHYSWREDIRNGGLMPYVPPNFLEITSHLEEHKAGGTKAPATKTIRSAIETTFPDSQETRTSAMLQWKKLSSVAHGLGWASSTRTDVTRDRATGLWGHQGSLAHYGPTTSLSYVLLLRGWEWFDLRSRAANAADPGREAETDADQQDGC